MKKSILSILCCPSCGRGLSLSVLKKEGKETVDGILSCCKCKKRYPVIAGIPRMLPSSMINSALMSGFRKRYGNIIAEKRTEISGADKLKERTSKSFGFQWNAFSEMYPEYEQNFLSYIEPLKPSFFKGKLVLDAGCGFGRHTYYAAKYGAQVVGFDLSDAVDAAYRNCGKMGNVHIVQGDIYHIPFRKEFGFIMSIGVLHHLPDPRAGYMNLVRLARPGTLVYAWLYGKEGRTFKTVFLEGTIRKVAVRMPQRMLYYFCYLPATLYHSSNLLYKALMKAGASMVAEKLPFKNYAKFPFRVKLADAYDFLGTPVNNYYTKEEALQWARKAKLKDISVTSLSGRSWRIFGKK